MGAALLVLISAAALCSLQAADVMAQGIRGRVVEEGTRRGIADVEVTAEDTLGVQHRRMLTDSLGRFRFVLDSGGHYVLRASHIGYATTMAPPVELSPSEEIEVELRLGIQAIPIEPLRVVTRRPERAGRLAEYYERKDRLERTGIGRVISREEIDARRVHASSELLRMVPGVRVVAQTRSVVMTRQGGGCAPAIYIDGMLMNRSGRALIDDWVTPNSIEGIEVYRGAAETPPQYRDHGGCGSILIWTRAGERSNRPFSWWRALVGGGILLAIILVAR